MLTDEQAKRYSIAYSTELQTLLQQKGNVLEQFGVRKEFQGEKFRYQRSQPLIMRGHPGRFTDTQIEEMYWDSRWLSSNPYNLAIGRDKIDDVRTASGNPTPIIVEEMGYAANRTRTKVFIDALVDDAVVGRNGTKTQALPASQKVALGYHRDASKSTAVGLTKDKLIRARSALVESHALDSMDGMANRTGDASMADAQMIVTQKQIEDLLYVTEVASIDYNVLRALVNGEPLAFMGFRFLKIQDFNKTGAHFLPFEDSNNTRTCIAFTNSAFCYTDKTEPFMRISERDDKNYAFQIYMEQDFGATRDEEGKVVTIDCVEAAA